MDISTFIRTLGVDEAAPLLGVSTHTAQAYMYRKRYPRPGQWPAIVERTKGKVRLADLSAGAIERGRAQ